MFVAVAGLAREPGQRPWIAKMSSDTFPERPELVGLVFRLRKAKHVGVYEVGPLLHQRGLTRAVAFVHQSQNRGLKRQGIEAGHNGRRRVGNRPLLIGTLITNPAELPAG